MMSTPRRSPQKPRQPSVRAGSLVGSKWVSNNWQALHEAAAANGGKVPDSIALITTHHPNEGIWNEEKLPTILFYLKPPATQYEGTVGHKIRNDGKKLRDFTLLPDRIGVDVKGWRIEAWRRLDPRIKYDDILERMTPDPEFCDGKGLCVPERNSLQMETYRSCRKLLGKWHIDGRQDETHRTMVEAIEKLSYDNLIFNTVLPRCDMFPDRVVKVKLDRKSEDGQFTLVPLEVTPENVNETTFPITYFCQHLPDGIGVFTESMKKAFELLLVLQERAENHGVDHWAKLNKYCRPATWSNKTKGAVPENRPFEDKNGDDRLEVRVDTYDGGCAGCTWNADRCYGRDYDIPEDVPFYEPPGRPARSAKPAAPTAKSRKRCLVATASEQGTSKRPKQEVDQTEPIDSLTHHETPSVGGGEDEESDHQVLSLSPFPSSPIRYTDIDNRSGTYTPRQLGSIHGKDIVDLQSSPPLSGYSMPDTRSRIAQRGLSRMQLNDRQEPVLSTALSNQSGLPQLLTMAPTVGFPPAPQYDLFYNGNSGPKATSLPYVQQLSTNLGQGSQLCHQILDNSNAFWRTNLARTYALPRNASLPMIGSYFAPDHGERTMDPTQYSRACFPSSAQSRTIDLQKALYQSDALADAYDLPQSIESPPLWINTEAMAAADVNTMPKAASSGSLLSEPDFHHFKRSGDCGAMLARASTPPLQYDECNTQQTMSFDDLLAMTPPQPEYDDTFFGAILHSDEVNGGFNDIYVRSHRTSPPSATQKQTLGAAHPCMIKQEDGVNDESFAQTMDDAEVAELLAFMSQST